MCITMGKDKTAYVCKREESVIEGHLEGLVCVGSRMEDN